MEQSEPQNQIAAEAEGTQVSDGECPNKRQRLSTPERETVYGDLLRAGYTPGETKRALRFHEPAYVSFYRGMSHVLQLQIGVLETCMILPKPLHALRQTGSQ